VTTCSNTPAFYPSPYPSKRAAARGSRRRCFLLLVALFSILLAEPAAAAIDRVFVGGGQGDGVDIAAVGFGLSEWASWEVWGAHLSASAVAKAQDWDGREARLNDKKVWDVSFTPTLRLQSQRPAGSLTPNLAWVFICSPGCASMRIELSALHSSSENFSAWALFSGRGANGT
jgi:hypothetical protein